MSEKDSLSLNLYGITVKLFLREKEITERLERYFSPFLKNGDQPDHILELEGNRIKIDGNVQRGNHESLPLLLEEIIFYINTTFWREVKDYLIFHSGAVKKGEKILLFPGFSGSGKSTLVAWHILKGWDYIGDDLIGISFKDQRLYPYPIPLRLKDPPEEIPRLFENIPDIKIDYFRQRKRRFYYIQPGNLFQEIPLPAEDLCSFIFPNFSPKEGPILKRLDTKTTFTTLLLHCVNFSSRPAEAFDIASHLARKVPGYELVYGRFEQIDDLMMGQSL